MGTCGEAADGGGQSGGTTPPPPTPATRAASPRFSDRTCACQVRGTGVEPFGFHPDIFLPGTLHHSGNKPAPPSDHIPLERRSAFWSARWKPFARPYSKFAATPCNPATVRARRGAVEVRSFFQKSERSFFV